MRQVVAMVALSAVLVAGCGDQPANTGAGNDARTGATAAGNYQREDGERGQGRGQRGGNWQQELRASVQAVRVPLNDAVAIATTQVVGPVVGVRLQGGEGGPSWSVQVMADTMFYAVVVSATSGEVLSVGPVQQRAPRGRGNGGERENGGERRERGNRERGSRGD